MIEWWDGIHPTCRQEWGFHFMARSSIKRDKINIFSSIFPPSTTLDISIEAHKIWIYLVKGQILQSCLPFKSIVQKFSSDRQFYLCQARPHRDHATNRDTKINKTQTVRVWVFSRDGHERVKVCPLHYGCKIRYEIHTFKLSSQSPC